MQFFNTLSRKLMQISKYIQLRHRLSVFQYFNYNLLLSQKWGIDDKLLIFFFKPFLFKISLNAYFPKFLYLI